MAKAQTFADKVAKMQKREAEVVCPKCNKSAKLLYAKLITSVKSAKGTWKFIERRAHVCNNCLAEV